MSMIVNERGASKLASTKSGVLRRKVPSRCRKDVICLCDRGRSAIVRIPQHSRTKQSSSRTLSLTAPWRRSPLRQCTKWRPSDPRGKRSRPGWKDHDRQFLSITYYSPLVICTCSIFSLYGNNSTLLFIGAVAVGIAIGCLYSSLLIYIMILIYIFLLSKPKFKLLRFVNIIGSQFFALVIRALFGRS